MRLTKIFIAAFICVMGMSTASAQDKMNVWPQGPATDNGHDNVAELTVYHPSASANTGKAIVICPGGGYTHLAMDHEGAMMAQWFADHGVTAAVLKYRLPHGNRVIPADDAREAMRIMRRNAAAWGVDPAQVGIAGSSAGGHLASTVCTHFQDSLSHPSFAVLFYPVISSDPAIWHSGSFKNLLGNQFADADMLQLYSNDRQVSETTPPTLLVLSDDDRTVPSLNSIHYYTALKKNGIKSTMHIYPTGGHGWGFRDKFKHVPEVKASILDWLELK